MGDGVDILLDEVQIHGECASVLNDFGHYDNADVYVTGFRGCGDEIHVHPLSFSEFYSMYDETVQKYVTLGAIPLVAAMNTGGQKSEYLIRLFY